MTDTYQVEKNIPLPSATLGKYNWARLEVSDSMFVPVGAKGRRPLRDSVRNAAKAHGKVYGKVFRTKMLADGIRVWRIL